jgi:membrane-bound ClpP family serine protease
MDTLLLWGFGLLALAGLLFFLEVFVPSGGILGLVSLAVAVAGVVAFWRYSALWGVTSSLVVLVMIPICFNFAIRIMPHTPFGKKLILGAATAPDNSGVGGDPARAPSLESLVGAQGVVLTELRPVGEVRVNGERYEGHAEEGIIEGGSTICVIGVDGDRLTVRLA